MSKIIDTIKHALIEDDAVPASSEAKSAGATAAGATPAPAGVKPAAAPAPQPLVPASESAWSEESQRIYQKILAKTDFQSTAAAGTIRKYLDPLSAIPSMDERTKFKTAVVQAKAQEGLTEEKILATFDGLKVALQNEQNSFASAAAQTREDEVTARQKKVQEVSDTIAAKQNEISQLQQRLSQMSAELVEAQGKIQRAESQFNIAAQRRAGEIDQEKAKYAGLLRG